MGSHIKRIRFITAVSANNLKLSDYITVQDVSEKLLCSNQKVYWMLGANWIKYVRISVKPSCGDMYSTYAIPRSEIDDILSGSHLYSESIMKYANNHRQGYQIGGGGSDREETRESQEK